MKTRKQILFEMEDVDLDKAVKIQGTEHDRRRKLTDKQLDRARELINLGVTYEECGKIFNVNFETIRRNVDPEWRLRRNTQRVESYARVGKVSPDLETFYRNLHERAAYKRELIANDRIAV